ncbi:hypothetical protein [Pseudomonas japonica]|uniref:Rap1a immunity protein domain-containing protein n=1 Tax=Pseudomonas japonica TaxID=256466 RepID=A0A239D8E1_9PSED|nr:hypothetical protein [Pseudomonas japonica]SNS28111.1 hypothetical protein SAMN05444352_105262 [Pseudomonas japonica]
MKTSNLAWIALSVIAGVLPMEHASADPDCSEPILKAEWGKEKVGTSYFTQGTYDSLQVYLDRAGCTYGPADTERILQEILARYESAPEWTSPKLNAQQMRDSVRFQLECQLSQSPIPDPITLEPRRQGVSLDAFKKMNCNTP